MEFRNQDEDTASTMPSSSVNYNSNPNQNQNSNPSSIRISPFSSPRPSMGTSTDTVAPTFTSLRNGNSSSKIPIQLQPNPSTASGTNIVTGTVTYHECLHNHAAALGGHVLDGCGEFMPSLRNPLKCAACTCHRSFHRKDCTNLMPSSSRIPLSLPPTHHQPYAYRNNANWHFNFNSSGLSGGTTTESSSEERTGTVAVVPGHQTPSQKRFRTKFTPGQKEKMMAFAERIGWRIKHDEHLVEQFCAEIGLRRQVLKVWMHNNKHNVRKQDHRQEMQLEQEAQTTIGRPVPADH